MLAWSVSLPGHPCCIWEPRLRGEGCVSSLCSWLWGLLQKFSVQLRKRSRESLKTQAVLATSEWLR